MEEAREREEWRWPDEEWERGKEGEREEENTRRCGLEGVCGRCVEGAKRCNEAGVEVERVEEEGKEQGC